MDKQDFMTIAKRMQDVYRPSAAVVERLKNIDLIAFIGPTGVGKSTLLHELGMHEVLSDVTRPKRHDEKDGKNYYFKDDYLKMLQQLKDGHYVQFTVSPYDEFYGTRPDAYPRSGHAAMAIVTSQLAAFERLPFRSITKFYITPPDYVTWMQRIGVERHAELSGRLHEARDSLQYAADHTSDLVFVLNDQLDVALRDVRLVLDGKQDQLESRRTQLAIDTIGLLQNMISASGE